MKGGNMVNGINAISTRSFGNGIVSVPKSPRQIAREEIESEKFREKLKEEQKEILEKLKEQYNNGEISGVKYYANTTIGNILNGLHNAPAHESICYMA